MTVHELSRTGARRIAVRAQVLDATRPTDLLDVVRCTWSLRPEGIEWPRHAEGELAGRPSFRLEDLSRANRLLHEAAHDALSDVNATIAMARLIRQRQPRLWDFCLRLRHKAAVVEEMGHGKPFVHLSGMYPAERGCLALVWPLDHLTWLSNPATTFAKVPAPGSGESTPAPSTTGGG